MAAARKSLLTKQVILKTCHYTASLIKYTMIESCMTLFGDIYMHVHILSQTYLTPLLIYIRYKAHYDVNKTINKC